jgi:hypothetical protein
MVPVKIVKIFDEKECESIVKDFEKNREFIKISTNHGVERISSYEINIKNLSKPIADLIQEKINTVIKPITGGKTGMVFGVRYSLDTKNYMSAHHDCNSYSCVVKLNEDYKGGGTYFPLSGEVLNPKEVGCGLLFKADTIMSYHEAFPITEGIRYVLVIRMENKNLINLILKAYFLSFVDKFIQKFKKRFYKKPLL